MTATAGSSGTTNKLSAEVEASCWSYNFSTETWEWKHTRNPAFWFLYFAHGLFLNTKDDYPAEYPYLDNALYRGFQNYPGLEDNIEHILGAGLTDEEIDLDKILEWAEFCEDQELYLDIVFREDTSCADVLERIANCGRGSSTYINGKLSVVYEAPNQVPTCMFGMGN